MSTDEQNVDLELAHENLENMKSKICEAGGAVSGFRPDTVFYNAELKTIRQFLVDSGLCTKAQYANSITSNLFEELADMSDLGLCDPGLLDDELDDVPK